MGRLLTRFLPVFLTVALAPITAHAECPSTRVDSKPLAREWQAALDALVQSTSEPGHPWSCAGGTISVEVGESDVELSVTRPGESVVRRRVSEPDDLVPLGQALLAAPLPAPPPPPAPSPKLELSPARDAVVAPAPRKDPRLFVGGGFDGRGVGGSGVPYAGIAANASVPMGHWLPTLSLRQQSALFSDGPGLDEFSVAIAVQYRLPISAVELRIGPAIRGAAVIRDFPRPYGEQGQLQARAGGVFSIVFPVLQRASLIAWVDGDGVVLSRDTSNTPVMTDISPIRSTAQVPIPTIRTLVPQS